MIYMEMDISAGTVPAGPNLTGRMGPGMNTNTQTDYMKSKFTVMQSYRKSSKTDTFHEPATYEPHVKTNSDQIITFDGHKNKQVGVFRIKIR